MALEKPIEYKEGVGINFGDIKVAPTEVKENINIPETLTGGRSLADS